MDARAEYPTPVKLLLDEMSSPRIAAQLRQRGHDVIAVAESAQLREQTDEVIFSIAQVETRVIVTRNVPDFRAIAIDALQRGEMHYGLVLISNRRFPGHYPHSIGRIANALDELLSMDPDLTDSETWIR
jgi:hypothetical protein